MDLKGRKILFIAPIYYGYEKIIEERLTRKGAEVIFFPEKRYGLFYGILNNISPKLITICQYFYYWLLINRIFSQKFSYFFLIRGFKIPKFFLKSLKRRNPEIISIMYQWDSNNNNPYFHIIKHFDKVFTFDYKDYNSRKEELSFLQLFYTDDIRDLHREELIKYDFFYFFSFTLERYQYLENLIEFCKEKNYKLKFFCYIPYSTYFRMKYIKGVKLSAELLSFTPMSRRKYLEYLKSSNIVIDYSHPTQTGLSMRIIEAYGARKKIVTTNQYIFNNPIYHPSWAQELNINDIKAPLYSDTKYDFEDLSIDTWLKKIFR